MAEDEGLRSRFGHAIREGVESQARAYRDYGALLDLLASRDIKSVEFAREAVDVYMAAFGKAVSVGVTLAGETLNAGMKGIGLAASATGIVARAVEKDTEAATDGNETGLAFDDEGTELVGETPPAEGATSTGA